MASIQKSTEKGYRIYWRLHFPDGTSREKYKVSRTKWVLKEILPDIMRIETLSRRHELTPKDLARALSLKIVTRKDIEQIGSPLGAYDNHCLEDLRADFETKSKNESASAHSHVTNISRANILESFFKDVPIGTITPEEIERFRADRKRTSTNTTVNHYLKVLRKYLDIAVSKGYVLDNAARRLKLLAEPKNRIPRCLYPEEVRLLFENLPQFNHLLYGEMDFIIRCLIYTGLRRDELCRLGPQNIKLHLKQIHVTGKGQKARVVGIHHSLLEEFKVRIKKPRIIHESIHPSSISHAFKRILRILRLPENLSLHSLRHTYISYLLEKGIPPKRVRERAGHFSLTMTDHYTHALPSDIIDEDVLDFTKEGMEKKGNE